jgi:stage V sporulation protein AA
MGIEGSTIYIKGDQNVEVDSPKVSLGDLLEIECVNKQLLAKVKTLHIVHLAKQNGQRSVVSVLQIIEKIHEAFPNAEIVNLGAPDIIVTYEKKQKNSKIAEGAKIALVSIITFVGSAFSIMTFNNDVDITKLFAQIYEQMTGEVKTGLTVLEFSYSLGIAIGILVFFNHFGKKKLAADPTPVNVAMHNYEKDVNQAIIENAERQGTEECE